jgi:chromodomain-helicase-DNA-binding protein 1
VNYNEDEADQDSFMEEEDDMTPNYWTTTAEDTGPVIDKILDHRPQSDIGMHLPCHCQQLLTARRT